MANAKRKTKLPDPAEWHSTARPSQHDGKCWSCSRPEVKAWLSRVVALNATSERPVPVIEMHRTLVDTVGYPRSWRALFDCVRRHHRDAKK